MKLVRYAVVCCFCLSAHMALGAADDTLPGAPIRPSPIVGRLSDADPADIFKIYLHHGDLLITSATYPIYTYVELLVLPTDAPDVSAPENIGTIFYPDAILQDEQANGTAFAPAADKDGTYSLVIHMPLGGDDSDYKLYWRVIPAQSDDAFPGVPLPPSPVNGSLNIQNDFYDIYRVHLSYGQSLRVSMNGWADLNLYGPPDPVPGKYWCWPWIFSTYNEYGLDTQFNYAPPPGFDGDYFILLRAESEAAQYRLDYQIVAADPKENYPGVPLPPSPVSGTLNTYTNGYDVYSVELKKGQAITALPGVHSGSFARIGYYPPECRNVVGLDYTEQYSSFHSQNGLWTPNVSGLIAPRDGRYSLVVDAGYTSNKIGDYRFQYSRMLISNISRTSYSLKWLDHTPRAYGDRDYLVVSNPEWSWGCLFIKTMNADKDLTTPWSFTIDVPVTLVVAFNVSGRPGWLANWTKLSDELSVTGDPNPRRALYARNFPAGKITLGGNRDPGMPTGNSMYNVLLLPVGTISGLNNSATDWGRYE